MIGGLLLFLDRWERRLCLAAFTVLATVMFADVAMRELSGNGIPWAGQAAVFANLIVALFGLGLATAAGSHLRPRFADNWLPQRYHPLLQRGADLVSAAALLLFAVIALQLVLETRQLAETATVLRIPLWPLQALIPLAFSSAALRYLAYSIQPALAPGNR
jgi:TRAP-type C4-dicarboxylate transport system permease small subunit